MKFVLYTEGPEFTGDSLEAGPLGGSETAFISLGRKLAAMGHSVVSYCRCPSPGIYYGVEFRDVPTFEQWRQNGETDVFVCSRWFPVLHLPVPARVTVFWNHDPYGHDYAALLRAALPNISYTYCLSEFHRQLFASVVGQPSADIRKTINGVDFDQIEPIRLGANKRHKIMFTSRPERGLMRTLDIYEMLGDRTLEFVAASYPYDGNESDQSIEKACADRITALKADGYPIEMGHFNKNDLYRHIAESKLVLYPSEVSEVFCIAAIESQACGTVFLGTTTCGLSETASHPGYDKDDLEGFAREATRLLTDDDYRAKAESVGLEHAAAFTWEMVARQFTDDAIAFLEAQENPNKTPEPVTPMTATVPAHRARSYYSKRTVPDQHDIRSATASTVAEPIGPIAPTSPAKTESTQLPLISCLMVTLDRLNQVKTAVRCYTDQTYPNRELVIVTDGSDIFQRALGRFLATLNRDDIKLICVPASGCTLGHLRNLALTEARGDWFCQWDDDDLYHPRRLEVQAADLAAKDLHASFLSDQLQFHWPSLTMRWVDWSRDDTFPLSHRLIPGTIMAHRDARFSYPETGPSARSGEDSAYVDSLTQQVDITTLSGAGMFYVYSYHSRNTYPEAHHAEHNGASKAFLESHISNLHQAISYYSLPRPYQFLGPDGQALLVMASSP